VTRSHTILRHIYFDRNCLFDSDFGATTLKSLSVAQIHPEQALAAAEARMELHELNVWKDNLLSVIEQPREEFKLVDFDCV